MTNFRHVRCWLHFSKHFLSPYQQWNRLLVLTKNTYVIGDDLGLEFDFLETEGREHRRRYEEKIRKIVRYQTDRLKNQNLYFISKSHVPMSHMIWSGGKGGMVIFPSFQVWKKKASLLIGILGRKDSIRLKFLNPQNARSRNLT